VEFEPPLLSQWMKWVLETPSVCLTMLVLPDEVNLSVVMAYIIFNERKNSLSCRLVSLTFFTQHAISPEWNNDSEMKYVAFPS